MPITNNHKQYYNKYYLFSLTLISNSNIAAKFCMLLTDAKIPNIGG